MPESYQELKRQWDEMESERERRSRAAPGSLHSRVGDLIDQWERRLKSAERLLDQYQREGYREGQHRMEIKNGVILSMLLELKREFRLANSN